MEAKREFGKPTHNAGHWQPGFLSILIPFISVLMIVAVLFISDMSAYSRANQRARNNLRSSAMEQSETLDAALEGQVDTLKAIAAELSTHSIDSSDSFVDYLKALVRDTSFHHICYALPDGISYMDNGMVHNIAERAYFANAMAGNWSIQLVDNPLSGETPLFVLAVPVIRNHRIIGAVHGSYRPEALQRLLIPKIYDGAAYSIICTTSGRILVGTDNPNSLLTGEHLFSALAAMKLENGVTLEQIKKSVENGESGSYSYQTSEGKRYVVYEPLHVPSATGERWIIFSIVPGSIVDSEATLASNLNSLLFALILLASAASFVFFYRREKKNAKQLEEERDRLHAIEEQNRIAIADSGLLLARYDLKTRLYHNQSDILFQQGFGTKIENVPEVFIEAGMVAPECVDDFRAFYENLQKGKAGILFVSLKTPDGSFRWFRKDATFVMDSSNKPYQAIVAYKDITEQREQEAIYAKWRQSVQERDANSYTLFRCNLSKGCSFDTMEGNLLKIDFTPAINTFNGRTREYAGQFVHLDDFDAYVSLLDSDYLLASYYRGAHTKTLDYRERVSESQYRWLRLTVEMVQYPAMDEIEVFLMYENIDHEKKTESAIRQRTDTDPLTGVLNRTAFIERFSQMLESEPECEHALILLDIDGFKQINDTFGHAAGDQALEDIAASLRRVVHGGDLLGRLGGDEFLVALQSIPNQTVLEKKAAQIKALLRKSFSLDVQISASMGIALYPRDGENFSTLYHHVDVALYAAKESGKDAYAFYNGSIIPSKLSGNASTAPSGKTRAARRHILVVDRDSELPTMLQDLFDDQFNIEVCCDEKNGMIRMHRYGVALSAVLLNMDMPELDGLALLDRIHRSNELKAIPVIAIVRADNRSLGLQAIQHGACDFMLKPFDLELLQVRVHSAIVKAENELLRAQNAYLQQQSGDKAKYRTVFENTGTIVVEYDWANAQFSYDPVISEYIYGKYDNRSLWQILLSDMVADAMDVKKMQTLVHDLAFGHTQTHTHMDIVLKTPAKTKHWFAMNAFKRVNNLNLTSRIVITFVDINEDVVAEEKLRFQAEHDSLTGLYNRNAFLRLVEKTVMDKPANSYILFCCDIDDFHFINERYGREEGDKLLQYSADRLLAHSDAIGGFTGRLGNDVYAMLVPNKPEIMDMAAAIIQSFYAKYPLNVKITCRAGAYIIDNPLMPADSMLDRASIAKDTIRGKYTVRLATFSERMNDQQKLEKEITDHMETALASGHFKPYIQPQYNHATGAIVGAEALVRWVDPQKGVISPGIFIPVFEKNGFITKMDEYVWEQAAKRFHEWLANGNKPVPLSVNVSREDIKEPELCHKLLAIIQRYDIPADLFRLEITESLFTDDTDRLIEVIEQLHECGFLIEMDDFGSGYSSLNILKDVPVDILKLDMRFFSGKDNLGRGGMIINSVIRMARWLNIRVIAEGVETKEQADFLLSVGCTTIQGYLYAKPMPIDDFEAQLTENQEELVVSENSVITELDTRSFWNPTSFDSQLFNRYIGAAIIFEYHDGEYEILRMNRQFIDTIQLNEDAMLPACGLINFYPEDRPSFKEAMLRAIATGQAVKADVRRALHEGQALMTLHITIRLMAKSDERALFFCTLAE